MAWLDGTQVGRGRYKDSSTATTIFFIHHHFSDQGKAFTKNLPDQKKSIHQ